MRVCVFSQNNPGVHSGGRYHALMLVECLAFAGHDVHYVTNALPVFFGDFERLKTHANIVVTLAPNFLPDLSDAAFDAVIVTPGRSDHLVYYNAARLVAMCSNAQLVLINFESGNWFNSLSPQTRDLSDWDHWKRIVAHGGTVLSSAHESDHWARKFYNQETHGDIRFSVWSPPINSVVADSVPELPKEKRAIIISRLSDPHKGLQTILDLLPDEMAGWTLTLIVGASQASEDFIGSLRAATDACGVTLDCLLSPDDSKKFEYIKRSRILIFPSMFEGYGYPPIEALYCNTEVVCYDLPVVKETCGEAPYYAPHGDQAALREALRKAVLDPLTGCRDHHAKIRDLARIDTAAERLERVLEMETAPNNKSTVVVSNAAVRKPSRNEYVRARVRQFILTQVRRLNLMRTRSGRKLYIQKYGFHNLIRQLTSVHAVVSGASINDMGVLRVHGWRAGGLTASTVRVCVDGDLVLPGTLGIKRPDVHKRYPQFKHDRVGFEAVSRIVDRDVRGCGVEILFYRKDELVDRLETVIEAAPSSAVHRLPSSRPNQGSACDDGVVVVAAGLADVYPGAVYTYDVLNIQAACRFSGRRFVLLVCGDGAAFQTCKSFLEEKFDEIILADDSKPVCQPDQTGKVPARLVVIQKAVEVVKAQHTLVDLVVVGIDLMPVFDCIPTGARKLLYLDRPPAAGFTIPEDVIIVSPQKDLVSTGAIACQHTTLHLPLHPAAFGDCQDPVYGSGRIVVPACDSPKMLDKVREFVCSLAREYPDLEARIECIDLQQQKDTAPESVGKLVFHRVGQVADTDLLYANAAFVLAPFFGPVSEASTAVLKRSLCQAAAFGRPILSTSKMARLHSDKSKFIIRNSKKAMFNTIRVMLRQTSERDALLHKSGFAYARNDPGYAYGEFKTILGTTNHQEEKLPLAAGTYRDPQITHAVENLILLVVSHVLRTQFSVRVLLGNDLVTANALITCLRRFDIKIEGLHRLTAGNTGGEFMKDHSVTLPVLNSTAPYVLATLSPEQAGEWDQVISRLGGHTVSLVPAVRRHEQEMLAELHQSARGRIVTIHDRYVAEDWPDEVPEKAIRIMTEAFVLSCKTSLSTLKRDDILVVTEERAGPAAIDMVLKANREIRVVSTLSDGAFAASVQNGIVCLDQSDPPWSEYFLTKTGQFDGLSSSLRLAHVMAFWMGSPVTRPQT